MYRPGMDTDEALKALADPLRLRLLQILHDRGETCVCELLAELGTTQSNISAHLRVLRAAGLVDSEKIGKWVFYRLDGETIGALLDELGAALDPATTARSRPDESLYACCQAGTVPLSQVAAGVAQPREHVQDV